MFIFIFFILIMPVANKQMKVAEWIEKQQKFFQNRNTFNVWFSQVLEMDRPKNFSAPS